MEDLIIFHRNFPKLDGSKEEMKNPFSTSRTRTINSTHSEEQILKIMLDGFFE